MFSRIVGSVRHKLSSSPTTNPTNPESSESSVGRERSAGKRPSAKEETEDDDDERARYRDGTKPERHCYHRPDFLQLEPDEEEKMKDHVTRPIIFTPDSDATKLPLGAGYAECINGGKSKLNEDQATAGKFVLSNQPNGFVDSTRKMDSIDVHYFGIFDGHAGTGAALMAADQLINHLQEKLVEVQEDLFHLRVRETYSSNVDNSQRSVITLDSLVCGALESAFISFDEHIARERIVFNITGGCATVVALVMLDRLYVAHAGDCRAVAYIGPDIVQMAHEFTPETDAERIQFLASVNPALMHDVFSEFCYQRPLSRKDLGSRVLCRSPCRQGWHYREISETDLGKVPLVSGQGKWARLMGVIGVTRGFGDHELRVPGTKIYVKPFLTAVPQVQVLNLFERRLTEEDVLVVGCDGLWDLLRNEQVGNALKTPLARTSGEKPKDRYAQAAREIVHLARGDNAGKGWKMKDGRDASFDDICAFVIPLQHCVTGHLGGGGKN